MSKLTSLEAYDLLKFAGAFAERLESARSILEGKRGHAAEKEWLGQALQVVQGVLPPAGLLERSRLLPELEELRDEAALQLQGDWVDALEKLHAGITFHAGSRAPVIETLFPHLKFPQLRKAATQAAQDFLSDLDRRRKGGYVTRMFGGEDFAFVLPVLAQLDAAVARWKGFLGGETLPESETTGLRQELLGAAKGVELALRQARLLAEAAFAPWNGLFEEAGLALKLKKRVGKPPPGAEPVAADVGSEEPPAVESTPVEPAVDAGATEPTPTAFEAAPLPEPLAAEPGAEPEAATGAPAAAAPAEAASDPAPAPKRRRGKAKAEPEIVPTVPPAEA